MSSLPCRSVAIASALFLACASTPPPPPRTTLRPVEPEPEETVVPAVAHVARNFEKERPPPARRVHQRIIGERDYQQLARRFAGGFKPDDCLAHCKSEAAFSADDRWTWVLRCKLDRTFKDEPAIACREEAMEADDAARFMKR